jgi:hypothetical protein
MFINKHFLFTKEYVCRENITCKHRYGNGLRTSISDVAKHCSNDPLCHSFDYHSSYPYGILCNSTETTKNVDDHKYKWCRLQQGKRLCSKTK